MFEKLIRSDQPEEDKHNNFYKAALLLVAKLESDRMDIRADSVRVRSKHIVPLLDDILFMMNAHQVLVRKALPQGKVSSGIYEHWMLEW
jgi:TRAP-type mannitol/chloroaromatic compound transport system permease small subunit